MKMNAIDQTAHRAVTDRSIDAGAGRRLLRGLASTATVALGLLSTTADAALAQTGAGGDVTARADDGYTFLLSDEVIRTPVRYRNRYGVEIAADLYRPKGL